ncbi:MAG: chorismate mutase [Saprospiraceae bacterium]|nr:chorismate mutase [Saprospiraceae bacterium]
MPGKTSHSSKKLSAPDKSETALIHNIAIQGYEGSFHQEAAQLYFGNEINIMPCDSFRTLIKYASRDENTSAAVMAIENSIAGSILPNYNLILNSDLQITGEIYLHIQQQLLVNPGVRIEDIREVHSHPMALLQCIDFLESPPGWKLVETEDTALSAKHLHLYHHKHAAAIAGKLAASLYGLDILAENIHSIANNYTRFLILHKKDCTHVSEGANKASVNFYTSHTKGALAQVLSIISEHLINLSKLQSMPIPQNQWTYSFHVDMEFDDISQFESALEEMSAYTEGIKVLGIYKNGKN